jgi:cation diffusion facilitator family transporter
MTHHTTNDGHGPLDAGIQVSGMSVAANLLLAITKIVTGIVGNSYALVADGIESTADVVSSLVVWSGLRLSNRPPDETHPYGHGKAESLAAVVVAVFLLGAAVLIAVQSIREIRTPHHLPEWYTLVVLALVIGIKESLFRLVSRTGEALTSSALKGDAWHHRSDALTSAAAFIGISVALIGGAGYEPADDWAALLACGVIFFNGLRLLRPALDEVMDAAAPRSLEAAVRGIASGVEGVREVEKCRIRKSGVGLLMDIHVVVDGSIPVREGHRIGHAVQDALYASDLGIHDAIVHIEPDGISTGTPGSS